VQVLHAHRAVRLGDVRAALVAVGFWQAETTVVAMLKLLSTSHPAYPTSLAMKLSLVDVIIQPAYTAKVSRTKDNPTLLAISFSRAPCVALQTFHFLHLLPVQAVCWLCFIMAKPENHKCGANFSVRKPAVVDLSTARCHKFAMSLVVFTPKLLSLLTHVVV